jgi:hypothetical protein
MTGSLLCVRHNDFEGMCGVGLVIVFMNEVVQRRLSPCSRAGRAVTSRARCFCSLSGVRSIYLTQPWWDHGWRTNREGAVFISTSASTCSCNVPLLPGCNLPYSPIPGKGKHWVWDNDLAVSCWYLCTLTSGCTYSVYDPDNGCL